MKKILNMKNNIQHFINLAFSQIVFNGVCYKKFYQANIISYDFSKEY